MLSSWLCFRRGYRRCGATLSSRTRLFRFSLSPAATDRWLAGSGKPLRGEAKRGDKWTVGS